MKRPWRPTAGTDSSRPTWTRCTGWRRRPGRSSTAPIRRPPSGPAAGTAARSGVELMHIEDPERRRWLQQRMETEEAARFDRSHILDLLRAETFEQMLQQRYLGTKRFSIEGVEP